jgi:cyclic pyranopterin phosphate synthase
LSFVEIERLVSVFARLGVRRVRLTGGEPTVRKGVVEIVGRLAAVPGLDEVVMTSNGHLLPDLAAPLAAAGLRGVNVSLDSLDVERFRRLTRRGDLARVIGGIDAALAAGLRVKINAVVLRDENDAEVAALCAFAWARGVLPRFIEHMPMSDGAVYHAAGHVSAAEIRARVEAAFGAPLSPVGEDAAAGPARYLALPDGRTLGVISAMTDHFCASCNRLRLTSTGDLHACLGYDDATDLRAILRGGGSDEDLRAAIAGAVTGKRAGHEFQLSGAGGPRKHMIAIGG